MMMAGATKIEEFKLSDDESKKLAKAITDVNQFYNLGVDPKLMVWVNLVTACTAIYAPKFVIYKMRKSMEAKNKKQKETPLENNPFPIGVS